MQSDTSGAAIIADQAQILAWIGLIALGAVLGLVGQTVRIVVGLKKRADAAVAAPDGKPEPFDATRLWISLLVGAAAGVLAILLGGIDFHRDVRQQFVALLGAGYAGADFLEAAVAKLGFGKGTD